MTQRARRDSARANLTPTDFFELQVRHFAALGMARPSELTALRARLPQTPDFIVRPSMPRKQNVRDVLRTMFPINGTECFISQWEWEREADEKGPQLMVGVDWGEARRGFAPGRAQESIHSSGHSPWGMWDGICAASVYPSQLARGGLDLVAVPCEPLAWPGLSREKNIVLSANYDRGDQSFRAPSCRQRFEV